MSIVFAASVPLFVFAMAKNRSTTPAIVQLGTVFLWAPMMLVFSHRSATKTVFNVELENDRIWIHTAWSTWEVMLDDIVRIDQRGCRITSVDRSLGVELASNAWIEMLKCIHETRPDIPIERAKPSILRRGDTFERIS